MYISKENLVAILSLVVTVTSSPINERSAPKCIGNEILSILHNPALSSSATKFCSSYLGIEPVTTTLQVPHTVTPATVTVTSTTATVIVTTTVANPVVQTVYTGTTDVDVATATLPEVIVTETSFTSTTVTATVAVAKRDSKGKSNPVPAWLAAFATKEVSSACSCLSIPAATVTNTVSTTYTAATPTATVDIDITNSAVIGTVTSSVEATSLVTVTLPASTSTTVKTATATSTFKVTPTQCSNLSASPVNYQSVGLLAIAGVGGSQTVTAANSPEECCSYCYTNQYCFGFAYGNYDPAYLDINNVFAPPPVSSGSQCYNYVFENTYYGCFYDGVAFGPDGEGAPAGGSASFGYGGCSVSPW